MKKSMILAVMLLCVALVAVGCGSSAGNANQTVGGVAGETLSPEEQAAKESTEAVKSTEADVEETSEVETSEPETEETQTEAPVTTEPQTEAEGDAVVNGTLIYQNDRYAYMPVDSQTENGWVILYEADGKGYGTPYFAYNLETGAEIYGEEGAEVYFCADGILQLEWRYPSGSRAGADTVLLYYPQYDGDPKTFDLYLVKYDFAGTKLSEEFILSYTQTEDYNVYYTEVYPVISAALETAGASTDMTYQTYSFNDVEGDAVAYDEAGNELIRYPGAGENCFMMVVSVKAGENRLYVTSMSFQCFTEVYELN